MSYPYLPPEDEKKKRLRERESGAYFPGTKNKTLQDIELIGHGIALPVRMALRKNVGTQTYNWWIVLVGFLWMRIWVMLSLAFAGNGYAWPFINPKIMEPLEAMLLNGLSYVFLLNSIYLSLRTERGYLKTDVPKEERINTKSWGQSRFFLPNEEGTERSNMPEIYEDLARKEWFHEAVKEPLLVLIPGLVFVFFTYMKVWGWFLVIGAVIFFLEEANRHRAKGTRFKSGEAAKQKAAKTRKDRERFRGEDDHYD
ncbi:MAG: hypothetical protein KDJ52_24075 [Anaerolineae bacterium]|nr:hypothetical protein [Anaerolineae bacterium]